MGFMRLLTNRQFMQSDVLTPEQAWATYDTFRADSRIVFLSEIPTFSDLWRNAARQISQSPNAWTDAYIAVFASHINATVVTLDRGFKMIGCAVTVLT